MNDLIFDIGMHNGDDTAYYLARGYRVVAVDANPAMCANARTRFAREISAGQLSVRNVGIAASPGQKEFWVSSATSRSSFHAEHATQAGSRAASITVETLPFRRLVEEEGSPFFVKIDIEGSDSLCLADLAGTASRPAYLSFEASIERAGADIRLLERLGYRSFKCIRQNDHCEITPRNVVYQGEFRRVLKGLELLPRIGIRGIIQRVHYRRRPINGRKFSSHSSGPLGAELPNRWLTADEVLSVWRRLVACHVRVCSDEGLTPPVEWFDIHAAHERVER